MPAYPHDSWHGSVVLAIVIVLVVGNCSAFLLMWMDKRRAQRGAWRLSERLLLLPVLFGGILGLLLGIQLLRHKHHSLAFQLGALWRLGACIGLIVVVYLSLPHP